MHAARDLAILLGAGLLAVGCRFPDSMTAADHEREAQHRRAGMASAEAAVRVQETTRPMPSGSESMADPGTPLVGMAGGRAAYDAQTAVRHEEAAQRIRRDAEVACLRVRPEDRSSCPIGEVARVEPLASGARLIFKTPPVAATMRAAVDCAVAEAHVDRPGDFATCPLDVPGMSARVIERAGGAVLEITAPDDARAAEVRARAEALLPR